MAKLYTFQVNVVHPQMQLEELIVNVSFHQDKEKKKGGLSGNQMCKTCKSWFWMRKRFLLMR